MQLYIIHQVIKPPHPGFLDSKTQLASFCSERACEKTKRSPVALPTTIFKNVTVLILSEGIGACN